MKEKKVGVYIRSRRVYNIIIMDMFAAEMIVTDMIARKRKSEQMKEYRQRPDRKQIEYENSTIKRLCDCGGSFTYKSKTKHERTNKHCKFVMEQQKRKDDDAVKDLELWGSVQPLF